MDRGPGSAGRRPWVLQLTLAHRVSMTQEQLTDSPCSVHLEDRRCRAHRSSTDTAQCRQQERSRDGQSPNTTTRPCLPRPAFSMASSWGTTSAPPSGSRQEARIRPGTTDTEGGRHSHCPWVAHSSECQVTQTPCGLSHSQHSRLRHRAGSVLMGP